MSISASTRRLTLALTLALSLSMFAAALLGPSQTLAKAHVSTCASARAKTRCIAHACPHKGKARRASKCGKHTGKKAKAPAQAAAHCEDGSTPARASSGAFSCADGSEPACANGAIPTRLGRRLLCPVIFGEEASSGETECEEGTAGCIAGTVPGAPSGEQACEGSASEGASVLCEGES